MGRGDYVPDDDNGGTRVVKILRSLPLPLDDNKKTCHSERPLLYHLQSPGHERDLKKYRN
ncbi:MAG: hypothetical protein WAO23_05415 [Dethiobacteria bacterium]